jgi:tetratricopeptide (TPR) repeat protein
MKKICALVIIIAVLAGSVLVAQDNPEPDPATPTPTPSPTPKPDVVVARADAVRLYNEKNYPEAVKTCLAEIKSSPGNRDSYIVIGWSYIALGQYAGAFEYSRLGIEKTGADSRLVANAEEALSKHYEQLYNLGKYDEALAKIQQLIAYLPNSGKIAEVYALMGQIYLKKGYYVYADTAFSFAVYSNPEVFEWWLGAGEAREKLTDFKSALAAYNSALKIKPDQQEALRGRDRVREKLSP